MRNILKYQFLDIVDIREDEFHPSFSTICTADTSREYCKYLLKENEIIYLQDMGEYKKIGLLANGDVFLSYK